MGEVGTPIYHIEPWKEGPMEGKLSRHALFGAFFAVALACSALFGFSAVPQAYADDSSQLVAQDSVAANLPDAEKQAILLDNLSKRFCVSGSDAAISNDTYLASLALNPLGKRMDVDVDACIEEAVKCATAGDPKERTAGRLAKYITILHAIGVDCTSVAYGGSTYNFISLMGSAMDESSLEDVYSAVCILPVYSFGYDMSGAVYDEAQVVQAVLDGQQANGLFGAEGWADVYTSGQALIGLHLVCPENEVAKVAAGKCISTIAGMQSENGSINDPNGSAVDSTALAVVALTAWGEDVTSGKYVTANGSTMLGFLLASASDSLDSIVGTWSEPMSASAVLLALSFYQENVTVDSLIELTSMKISMYRLYNPNSGEHFYTKTTAERNHLVSVGWSDESYGWVSPAVSDAPVYRLYNPNGGDHHYTESAEERDGLVKLGWRYEGIGWYSDTNKTIPVYRQYNPNADTGSHNFTPSTEERDILIAVGWNDEGIGWYGVK